MSILILCMCTHETHISLELHVKDEITHMLSLQHIKQLQCMILDVFSLMMLHTTRWCCHAGSLALHGRKGTSFCFSHFYFWIKATHHWGMSNTSREQIPEQQKKKKQFAIKLLLCQGLLSQLCDSGQLLYWYCPLLPHKLTAPRHNTQLSPVKTEFCKHVRKHWILPLLQSRITIGLLFARSLQLNSSTWLLLNVLASHVSSHLVCSLTVEHWITQSWLF